MGPPPPQPAGAVDFDFDGDGKADIGRWHASNTEFKIKNSNGGSYSTYTIGSSSAIAAPADYDGDGRTDAATFSSGTWTIRKSSDGTTTTITGFGQSGDIPTSGNYTGSSADELACFRPSNGTWYWREFTNSTVYSMQYGTSGDVPVAGDYDGDGDMEPAIFRPSTGYWWISSTGAVAWGLSSDIPVPADFDGDGKTDATVYRGSTGTWYSLKSGSPGQYVAQVWGNYGDQPIAGDFDGDGKADLAVWRPTTGIWYILKSSNLSYDFQTLGVAGDTAIPSAYTKQIGGAVATLELEKARLKPRNATGGTDLYSQNFSWGTSLVSLPGRAGLDAGIGISYNSLIWTKDAVNSTIYFDADYANITPGFRFGFPTIEPVFYNDVTQKFTYIMLTPSGKRVEFRQTAASDTYETADSSYMQLITKGADSPNDPVENISISVRTTGGTTLSYEWKAGTFRCNEIKDRNGNFITVYHDDQGLLKTVTDTLGRVITVNYDTELYPTSITQDWRPDNGSSYSAQTHTYATFSYSTVSINTNFTGLTVFGPPNGWQEKVLSKITYGTSSDNTGDTRFEYNGYGQVVKIRNYAADGHELNYVRTNLDSVSGTQTDCPRFTATYSWAQDFNVVGGQPQEVAITNTYQENQPLPGGGTATLLTVTSPDGLDPAGVVIEKNYVPGSGWSEALPFYSAVCATSTCTGNDLKKWTWTFWGQDDPNASYIVNPRMTSNVVSDSGSSRKTEIDYYTISQGSSVSEYGLAKEIRVIDVYNSNTLLKKSTVDYNRDNAYISRRIIGLPAIVESWGRNDLTGSLEQVSKTTYSYDEGNFADSSLQQNISPTQHDNANFSSSFITGRGNLTSLIRWDATQPSNANLAIASNIKYNTAGSPVAQITPWDGTNTRTVRIGYADNFNSSGNPTTYAYPTVLTDPAGSSLGDTAHSSVVQYRYDIGANVHAQSPAPNGNSQGKISERLFDNFGRLSKETIVNNGAYTRYEYPTNGIQSKVYSTVIDVNNNGIGDTADEVFSENWTDGAGRVIKSRTEHPGSIGGFSATLAVYDLLGRVRKQSVPTEVDSSWNPAGDDQSRGWIWNSKEYDWKGRVKRIIPSDSNGSDGKDQVYTYEGCGCAGGMVATVQGENIVETDWQGNPTTTLGRRKQKIYQDVLGRTYKTEVYNWNDTIHSTVVNSFNGRDQVVRSRQFSGDQYSNSYQETVSAYDGFGRQASMHVPIQAANRPTTYEYFQDGQVKKVTDAQGSSTNYAYNSQGLVEQIDYSLPNSVEGLTPWVYQVERIGNDVLKVKGGNFASNVQVTLYTFDNTTGNFSTADTVSGAAITRGTEGDYQTAQFSVTSQAVLAAMNNPLGHISAYLDVTNVDSGQRSPRAFLWYENSNVAGGAGSSDAPLAASSVHFEYDALGDRTSMHDGLGTVSYQYDQLSRMTAETRQFNDTLANAPLPNNSFLLQYSYQLSGTLKSITDPYGQETDYGFDDVGRLSSVTGSNFGGITNYASGAQYRAWGGLKGLSYGNGVHMSETFNNRLLPDHYELSKDATDIMKKNYQYLNDGQLRYLQDQLDPRYDRLNSYDHEGRVQEAKTGLEARGGTVTTDLGQNLPYRQSFEFNAFGNLTQRNNLHWGVTDWYNQHNNLNYTYQDNRITNPDWRYDAEGRVTHTASPDDYASSTYDARGLLVRFDSGSQSVITRFYNGDARETKRTTSTWVEDPQATQPPYGSWVDDDPIYYIRSSVFGGEVISEADGTGRKKKTYVMAAGARIATQSQYTYNGNTSQTVNWEHTDASGMSYRSTTSNGTAISGDGGEGSPVEADPMGGNVGTYTPYVEIVQPWQPPEGYENALIVIGDESPTYVDGQRVTCNLDGLAIGCSQAYQMLDHGSAIPAALGPYQNLPGFHFESYGLGIYSVTIPRQVGWNVTNGPNDGPNGTAHPVFSGGNTYSFSVNWPNISWQPQTRTPPYDKDKLLKDASDVIKNASGACAKLLGKDAFEKFQERMKNFEYDPKNLNVPTTSDARTFPETGDTYLNPWSPVFNEGSRTIVPIPPGIAKSDKKWYDQMNKRPTDYAKLITESGVDNYNFAVAAVIHEFLHQIGVFDPDAGDGNNKESLKNQQKVIDACFKNQKQN